MRPLLHRLAAVALLALPVPASAADDRPSIHSLIAASDLVVVGRIARTAQVERDNDMHDISYNGSRRYIAVIATLQVEETLLGDAPTGPVKFVYPKRPRLAGEPVYDLDQDGVWLLRRAENGREYLADEIGRFQPRERKEQVKAIIARFSINNNAGGGTAASGSGDTPPPANGGEKPRQN